MSLRLETPEALWGLIPLAFLLTLMLVRGLRTRTLSWRRLVFAALGFSCCLAGLARPQGGHLVTTQRGMRGNLYLAVDISRSMRAEDLSPSRLGFAIAFVQRLLGELPGLRVALFPFAGDGYIQMPLSADLDAAKDLVASLTPSLTTNQGTGFETSLETLFQAIEKAQAAHRLESAPTRVLLLSDGETHETVNKGTLDKFRTHSIPIDTVGVGTRNGGYIPIEGHLGFGRETLRDTSGQLVRSRLEERSLRSLAEHTGGNYYGPRFEEVERIASRILQAMQFGMFSTSFKIEHEYYPVFFLSALLIFSLEFALGQWHFFIRAAIFVLLAGTVSRSGQALSFETESKLGASSQTRPYLAYDEGVRQAKKGSLGEAADLFLESAATTEDPSLKKKALYNLGNTLLKLSDPTQALGAYQRAYDTQSSNAAEESEINRMISENILLAQKQKQSQKQQQEKEEGEGAGQSEEPAADPGKAKQFQAQSLDDVQKKRVFDLVSSEDQQVRERQQQRQNPRPDKTRRGNQW